MRNMQKQMRPTSHMVHIFRLEFYYQRWSVTGGLTSDGAESSKITYLGAQSYLTLNSVSHLFVSTATAIRNKMALQHNNRALSLLFCDTRETASE